MTERTNIHLTLVRHAEPLWSAGPDAGVLRDPELSTRGMEQLPFLKEELRRHAFDVVLTSPMKRARISYEHSSSTSEEAQLAEWLREITYPDWSRDPLPDVKQVLLQHFRAGAESRLEGLPGGESPTTYLRFVDAGFSAFLCDRGISRTATPGLWTRPSDGLRACIYGHMGSISSMVGSLLGAPLTPWVRQQLHVGHASITRLSMFFVGDLGAFALDKLGDQSFLPEDLRV